MSTLLTLDHIKPKSEYDSVRPLLETLSSVSSEFRTVPVGPVTFVFTGFDEALFLAHERIHADDSMPVERQQQIVSELAGLLSRDSVVKAAVFPSTTDSEMIDLYDIAENTSMVFSDGSYCFADRSAKSRLPLHSGLGVIGIASAVRFSLSEHQARMFASGDVEIMVEVNGRLYSTEIDDDLKNMLTVDIGWDGGVELVPA